MSVYYGLYQIVTVHDSLWKFMTVHDSSWQLNTVHNGSCNGGWRRTGPMVRHLRRPRAQLRDVHTPPGPSSMREMPQPRTHGTGLPGPEPGHKPSTWQATPERARQPSATSPWRCAPTAGSRWRGGSPTRCGLHIPPLHPPTQGAGSTCPGPHPP